MACFTPSRFPSLVMAVGSLPSVSGLTLSRSRGCCSMLLLSFHCFRVFERDRACSSDVLSRFERVTLLKSFSLLGFKSICEEGQARKLCLLDELPSLSLLSQFFLVERPCE